jgi:hypothetical protein
MFTASLYIASKSARNRIAVRLRRLREPRYLAGAVLAAAYFLFIFVVPRRAGRRRPGGRRFPATPVLDEYGLALGGAALFVLSATAWLFPSRSHLFTFTEAEMAFLFPAPVSRRQLLVHRLIRSQLGLLFAAMVPAFLFAPGAGTPAAQRLRFAMGLWIVLSTTRIYFAGVTMARDHLASGDWRARATAWAPLLVTLAAIVAVGVPIARAVSLPIESIPEVLARIGETAQSGWPSVVLWPFQLLIAPMFADGGIEYAAAFAGSLLVLAANFVWVLESDRVFHAAGGEDAAAPMSAGNVRPAAAPKVRWAAWSLPVAGRTETAFFWKNALETLRGTNVKSLIPIAILLVYAVVGARFGMAASLEPAVCLAALMAAGFTTLMGPWSVMSDLRTDLRHMEVLKTWPVKAGAVLRGEMLWPGALVTACVWLALTVAVALSRAAFPQVPLVWRLSAYGVAMLAAPAFVFAQYTIHQTAAVLFPAWIPADNEMRGFESMAQRLILFAGVSLALIVMVGPGAAAGGIVGFAFYRLIGSPLVFVPAAAVCLAVVAIELVLATEALGPAYDRIDLSGIERRE